MMGLARRAMSRVPDIGFWKLCGSGTGEGFTPIPNTGVYAILACWPDQDTAVHRLATTDVFRRYRSQASECWTLFLRTTSVRGAWSGQAPFQPGAAAPGKPVAALTRATIKPAAALKFWRRVPDISRMVGDDPNVAFKIGIGEVPLLHQITFSIWPDPETMAAFARTNGPHAAAIRAVRDGKWFSEELYARFDILGDRGSWNGASPLCALETAA
ncbi:hypothetical protein So717_12050 [Roseobacter cerasinus]|uniref:Spheroidene monooxygenase n=2 Tax=Roseobacter cerasinus TaxID=2602289 RepID=A0A640VP51_9RHOB|nr:hypothetical protein So717_12050 [Roseobacter cerasinus]